MMGQTFIRRILKFLSVATILVVIAIAIIALRAAIWLPSHLQW